jgi:hypothetical protein
LVRKSKTTAPSFNAVQTTSGRNSQRQLSLFDCITAADPNKIAYQYARHCIKISHHGKEKDGRRQLPVAQEAADLAAQPA